LNFGEYRLDVRTRQLFRGTTEVHLSPKAFDLLQMLAENPTRAVSKSELHHHLWPATFVSEANLASLIAELRRALGDHSRVPRFIRTVRRFGYAFCAEVTGEADAAPRGQNCWIVWRGHEIPMHDGENILGRDPGVTASFDSPSVSRRHARITVSRDGVTVEDLGSKNGTMLRSKRITGPVRLADHDELQIGSVCVIVRVMGHGESTETFEM
jgi:DNA-binding winged helix-turn-helix (wHTH) protein